MSPVQFSIEITEQIKFIITCSTSRSVTQRKELLLAHSSSGVQKPKNDCTVPMTEKRVTRCLRFPVAFEQFLLHVSKPHKVYHCLPPDQWNKKYLKHPFTVSLTNQKSMKNNQTNLYDGSFFSVPNILMKVMQKYGDYQYVFYSAS